MLFFVKKPKVTSNTVSDHEHYVVSRDSLDQQLDSLSKLLTDTLRRLNTPPSKDDHPKFRHSKGRK